jgi:hypothetical protein
MYYWRIGNLFIEAIFCNSIWSCRLPGNMSNSWSRGIICTIAMFGGGVLKRKWKNKNKKTAWMLQRRVNSERCLRNWFWRTRRRRWTKSSGILMVTTSCVGTQLRSYRACSHRLQKVHHRDSSPTLRKLKTLVPSLTRPTQNKRTRIRIGVAFTRGCGMLCFCFFCYNIMWETTKEKVL